MGWELTSTYDMHQAYSAGAQSHEMGLSSGLFVMAAAKEGRGQTNSHVNVSVA